MTAEDHDAIVRIQTFLEDFGRRYDRDEENRVKWREKVEKKLDEDIIKPLRVGNGKPGLFTRVDRLEQAVKRIGAWAVALLGIVGIFLGSRGDTWKAILNQLFK